MASPPGAVGMPVVETIATIRRAFFTYPIRSGLPCCAARLRGGTKRMIAFNGPTQRSPTLNDAINARRWLRLCDLPQVERKRRICPHETFHRSGAKRYGRPVSRITRKFVCWSAVQFRLSLYSQKTRHAILFHQRLLGLIGATHGRIRVLSQGARATDLPERGSRFNLRGHIKLNECDVTIYGWSSPRKHHEWTVSLLM